MNFAAFVNCSVRPAKEASLLAIHGNGKICLTFCGICAIILMYDFRYADPSKAKELLGWEATADLQQMCADSWRFTKQNPNGM